MLMVDMRNSNARITLREVLASGRRYVSNPIAFATFMDGLKLTPELLLDPGWQRPAGASGRFPFFRAVMHDVLPRVYDVRRLEALGGRFALRLTGVGDYSVVALNRRVVTFSGPPLDEETGKPVIDAEMRADVFLALCNELIASLSETIIRRADAVRARASASEAR
jgi:hypothetical protein